MTDTLHFLDAVCGLPEQLTTAHELAGGIDPVRFPKVAEIDHVVVAGMGGSGIAGDVLAAVATDAPVPIITLKRYRVPAFVGPRTLFVALSYSGDTEETIAMTTEAVARGARVVAVSVGGALERLASDADGIHVPCPSGLLPRAALGALVGPLFVTMLRTGVVPGAHRLLVGAQDQLARRRDKCQPSVEGAANVARELARKIDRTFPLIYGGGALGAVAAYRWKCDVNENAKAPAFWHTYPELDHNEICGWGQHGDVTRQLITLVELRHSFEHAQIARRFDATRDIIDETLHQVLSLDAEGDGRLAQVLDLMYVGDFASTYLALDNDVDPGPIDAIFDLKARLAD